MINILIFANCHGTLYKNALVKAEVFNRCNIEHVLSYENIRNFNGLKEKFSRCDVLVIQPIQSYEEFKIENLKLILKPSCHIIRVPFIRFNGFWPPNDIRELDRINKDAVMFFPRIYKEYEVSPYLHGISLDESLILSTFDDAVNRLVELEKTGDVEFVDFFKKNYKDIPLFRDPYHPTMPFSEYIALQINRMVEEYLFSTGRDLPQDTSNITWNKEYGHFKPITNRFAQVLGLKYDLNSYFMYSRYDFLTGVLRCEKGTHSINDLNDLRNYFDKEYIR